MLLPLYTSSSIAEAAVSCFFFFLITKPLFFYKLISYSGKTTRPARACTHLQVAFYFTYYIYIGLYSVDALYMPPSPPNIYIYIFFISSCDGHHQLRWQKARTRHGTALARQKDKTRGAQPFGIVYNHLNITSRHQIPSYSYSSSTLTLNTIRLII